jgi:hypothetical protein
VKIVVPAFGNLLLTLPLNSGIKILLFTKIRFCLRSSIYIL